MKEKMLSILEVIGTTLMIAMSTLVFIQVLSRFIFEIPAPWIEELSKLLLIWLTYILLTSTFMRDYHVRVDLIDEWISSKLSYLFKTLINILGIVLSFVSLYYIYLFFSKQLQFGQSTPIMKLPMYMVTIPLLFGVAFTAIYFILEVCSNVKTIKEKRWEDNS